MPKAEKAKTERDLEELLEENATIDIPRGDALAGVEGSGGRLAVGVGQESLRPRVAGSARKSADRLGTDLPLASGPRPDSPSFEPSRVGSSLPRPSERVRVFDLGELTSEAGAAGDPFASSSPSGTADITLSSQHIVRLVESFRARADIAPESRLFVRDPASGGLVPAPGDRPAINSARMTPPPGLMQQYRLDFQFGRYILGIHFYEESKMFEFHATDRDPERVGRSVARIAELLAPVPPDDYDALSGGLVELMHLVQQEVAARLATGFKKKLLEIPNQSYGDKQALTKWANSELRRFGLTVGWKVREPTEGGHAERIYPACLVTHVGNHPTEGRFQIRFRDEHGKLRQPLSSPDIRIIIEKMEVMIDDPLRYRTGKWVDQVVGPGQADRPR